MAIIYNRVVTVKLPQGAIGRLKSFQTEVEERFSNKENFINWYNENYEVKIDRGVEAKFVSATCACKTICRLMNTNKENVPILWLPIEPRIH